MYAPKDFEISDLNKLHDFIVEYNFATLVSAYKNKTEVSHLPLILDSNRGKYGTLLGHMAKANSHAKKLPNTDVLVIFQGPYAYISPRWYKNPMNVPTWNYATIHVTGKAKLIDDFSGIEKILSEQIKFEEMRIVGSWSYDLPENFRKNLVGAIVAFEIEILDIKGKFKMSQNKSEDDQEAALDGVASQYSNTRPDFVEFMRNSLKQNGD